MKWFKHDSDANSDAKLKRVRMRYGLEGYGLYWYCLELIAQGVDHNKFTFELEHDAEIIAFDTGISCERVTEMMSFMVALGLFEESAGRITCLKMARRLDQSMTSSPKMRQLIGQITKNRHDAIMTESCQSADKVMQDKNRLDKNRIDNNILSPPLSDSSNKSNKKPPGFERFFAAYPENKKGGRSTSAWKKAKSLKLAEDDYLAMLANLEQRKAQCPRWWSTYAPGICKYLDDHIWKAPIIPEIDNEAHSAGGRPSRHEQIRAGVEQYLSTSR